MQRLATLSLKNRALIALITVFAAILSDFHRNSSNKS